ncbi:hypothetical protein C6P46_004819 [Rhodotorula mucilaginosa]|uniref:FIST domain-containing protein n=1 Tax=Rhodotorula mucilaginosa TaxID=5537 RepID=A0A9P6W1S5_RHOMI|nr:hypothetical protein C6P46_004819 [Rhodotorula mucilaginosa]
MLRIRLRRTILLSAPAVQRRSLWQCATLSSPSPTALLENVQETVAEDAAAAVTVFALSKNVPQQLVSAFRRALAPSGSNTTAIGCLSEILPAAASSTSPLLKDQELFSIALARHRPTRDTERAIPFRSALVGRPNIALGREIKPELQADHDQVDSGLEAFLKGGAWGFGEQTQAEVSTQHPEIAELKNENPSAIRELVVFTADRTQPFLAALSRFSEASTVGMVGTSTPFHSADGSAFTLFYGDETTASGAVGVAVVDASPEHHGTPVALGYGGLAPIGASYEVTSAQGNIVLSLSGQNAARLLLNAVNDLFGTSAANLPAAQRTHEKEKEFYAAVFDSEPKCPLDLCKARIVARIMAGDPSRGAMSVETGEEVKKGSHIVLAFLAVPASNSAPHFSATECPGTGDVSTSQRFLAASENGVVIESGEVGTARPPPRICAIEGTRTTLQ